MSVSPERRNAKKSKPEYLHVCQTLKRIRYSSIPFGFERPSDGTAKPGKRLDCVFGVIVVPRYVIELQKCE